MIIPKELDYILGLQKRKDAKERILKVYNALLYKRGSKIGKSYFDCPSSYLKKVSGQYNIVLKLFLDYKIIDFYSKSNEEKWDDIFQPYTLRRKKYYNTETGQCSKYRFIIDTEEGYKLEFNQDYSCVYNNEKWYQKTRYSLLQLNFGSEEINIKRDNFSRRLHTNITGPIDGWKSYRNLLSGGKYYAIDSKTSQPRLLWLKLNEIGLQDEKLNYIFENYLDFYQYIMDRIPVLNNDRDEAKELFASWINGTGYLDQDKASIRDIFPVAQSFIKNYKTASYKNVCRLLQYTESTIFIDDLLNNVPVEFCLTVHDSLIVKKEDADMVLQWCRERRPELRFEKEEIKVK